MIQMEFSYSPVFGGKYINYFILSLPFVYLLIELFVLEALLRESLSFVGFLSAITLVSNMTTMGASNFVAFVVSYILGLLLTLIARLYQNPMINQILSLTPRWIMQFNRYLRGNKRMTRDEKAKEELEWRRINEEIELESEGIEPLLSAYSDYALESVALLLQPLLYYQLDTF
jgi:hypothetical protein